MYICRYLKNETIKSTKHVSSMRCNGMGEGEVRICL